MISHKKYIKMQALMMRLLNKFINNIYSKNIYYFFVEKKIN